MLLNNLDKITLIICLVAIFVLEVMSRNASGRGIALGVLVYGIIWFILTWIGGR